MMYKSRRHRVAVIILIALLGRLTPVRAQEVSIDVADYALPSERVVTLQPPLHHNGHIYEIHYFTTGSTDRTNSSLIGLASPSSFSNQQITGLLITVDGTVVEDEETLREIFTLYRSAYYLYEVAASGPLGFTDFYPFDDFRSDLRKITRNPLFVTQFIKGAFDTRKEKTEEALRAILTAQRPPPEDVEAFKQEVLRRVEQEKDLISIVKRTLEAAKFSNKRIVRDVAEGVRKTFKSWRPVTEQGQSLIKIKGRRLEFFNALDVLSLGINLMWITDLQQDRAEWLDSYSTFAVGDAAFNEDQLRATATVIKEAEDNWVQRGNIILAFVEDQTIDFSIRIVTEELSRKWVKLSWQKYGKRIAGHNAAGAASAVLLGFTLADILYGLDDLYSNFTVAESCDELRRVFLAGRTQLQKKVIVSNEDYYDGELAAQFRIAYMLESLTAAQALRSYSDGVGATVRKGVTALFNPINWFRGKEWREAAAGLRDIANDLETEAENKIGHPDFVDAAVVLVMQRLAMGPDPRKGLPLHDSALISSSDFMILHPGQSDEIVFDVQNTGKVTWAPQQGYALINTNDESLGAPAIQALTSDVQYGRIARWVIPITAPSQAGLKWTEWQMAHNGEPFGSVMSCLVTVVPEEEEIHIDPIELLKGWFDELKQQISDELNELWEDLMRRFEEWLQRELERLWREFWESLFRQCCGANVVAPAVLLLGAWGINHKRRRGMKDGDRD